MCCVDMDLAEGEIVEVHYSLTGVDIFAEELTKFYLFDGY